MGSCSNILGMPGAQRYGSLDGTRGKKRWKPTYKEWNLLGTGDLNVMVK